MKREERAERAAHSFTHTVNRPKISFSVVRGANGYLAKGGCGDNSLDPSNAFPRKCPLPHDEPPKLASASISPALLQPPACMIGAPARAAEPEHREEIRRAPDGKAIASTNQSPRRVSTLSADLSSTQDEDKTTPLGQLPARGVVVLALINDAAPVGEEGRANGIRQSICGLPTPK